MFTGIIEEIGKVKSFERCSNGALITVECQTVLNGTKIGDSISVNGVCQTVIEMDNKTFRANISDETLHVTAFTDLKSGDEVNLERALMLSSRLGGHLVSGHVDCKGKFLYSKKLSDFYDLVFDVPHEYKKYVVRKGSVAINGISLTVANVEGNVFKAAVIPHTFNNTNLKNLKSGDYVNIETDILGKYVEKFLSLNDNKTSISMKFLQENGFV